MLCGDGVYGTALGQDNVNGTIVCGVYIFWSSCIVCKIYVYTYKLRRKAGENLRITNRIFQRKDTDVPTKSEHLLRLLKRFHTTRGALTSLC